MLVRTSRGELLCQQYLAFAWEGNKMNNMTKMTVEEMFELLVSRGAGYPAAARRREIIRALARVLDPAELAAAQAAADVDDDAS